MNWFEVICAGIGGGVGGALGGLVAAMFRGRTGKSSGVAVAVTVIPAIIFMQIGVAVSKSESFRDLIKPPSRVELAIRQHENEVDPAVSERFKGLNVAEAHQLGTELSHAGLKRLPAEDLVRWNSVKLVMAQGSKAVCAGFWTGKLDESALMTSLERLSDADLNDWMRVSFKAMSLEARGGPAPTMPPDALAVDLGKVVDRLPESQKGRFQKALATGTALADDDACWTMTTLMVTANSLPSGDRESLLRALAAL